MSKNLHFELDLCFNMCKSVFDETSQMERFIGSTIWQRNLEDDKR
jgi:hypothetical protein